MDWLFRYENPIFFQKKKKTSTCTKSFRCSNFPQPSIRTSKATDNRKTVKRIVPWDKMRKPRFEISMDGRIFEYKSVGRPLCVFATENFRISAKFPPLGGDTLKLARLNLYDALVFGRR